MDLLVDLIAIAQSMADGTFDPQVFFSWQVLGFLVLLSLFGPFHYYTRNFKRLTSEEGKRGVLAGEGILEAAKQTIASGTSRIGSEVVADSETPLVKVKLPTRLLERLKQVVAGDPVPLRISGPTVER